MIHLLARLLSSFVYHFAACVTVFTFTCQANTDEARERSYEARLLAQMDASSANKCTAPLNSAVLAFVGPGEAGKTSAILAIQNLALAKQRQSTCGGEGSRLVACINMQQLQGFMKASSDLSRVQRALQMLLDQSAQIDDNGVDLDCFVTGSDTHDSISGVRLMAQNSMTKAKPAPMPRPSQVSVSKLHRAAHGSSSIPLFHHALPPLCYSHQRDW